MRRRRRRPKGRKQWGGALANALSAMLPIGKGAALGLAKALGGRAVKTGIRAGTTAAIGGVGVGVGRGIRRLVRLKKRRPPRR